MKLFKGVLTCCLVSVLAACASHDITTDYRTDVNFSNYQSFALLPVDPTVYSNPKLSEISVRRVGTLLGKELARRFTEAEQGAADFHVRYFVVLEDRMKVENYNATFGMYRSGYGYRYGFDTPDLHNTYYQQGSIIIDILDSKTDEVVWRGSTEGKVNDRLSPAERDNRVADQLAELMAKFPPQ